MLVVNPIRSLFDSSAIQICAIGLRPGQKVTIAAECAIESVRFGSRALFEADHEGIVNLNNAESKGGSFVGRHKMGLFWSMTPFPSNQIGTPLFMPKDSEVRNGLRYDLKLYDGHSNDLPEKDLLCKSISHRLFMAANVQRIEVRENGLVGTLFLPRRDRKLPVVIDLYGTRGGLLEYRAALLSSHGFATFAVAYFDFEDLLPKKIKEVDMTYFVVGS